MWVVHGFIICCVNVFCDCFFKSFLCYFVLNGSVQTLKSSSGAICLFQISDWRFFAESWVMYFFAKNSLLNTIV